MTKNKQTVEDLQFNLDHIRQEILRYFGPIPHFAREAGYADGESLVVMGNGLLWISGYLDRADLPDQPVGETAETIKSLAHQFQEAGREIWHFDPAKNSGLSAKVHRMELQMRTLQQMVLKQGFSEAAEKAVAG